MLNPPLKDLILPLIPAIGGLFNLPCSISAKQDAECISFENIQLSTQGAERQRKDATWQSQIFQLYHNA